MGISLALYLPDSTRQRFEAFIEAIRNETTAHPYAPKTRRTSIARQLFERGLTLAERELKRKA